MNGFELLYFLIPLISSIFAVLSYFFRFYKRSVSTFIVLHMIAISSNAIYFGYFVIAMLTILVFMLFLFVRAIAKDESDKWFILPYDGVEKRNSSKERINALS